MKDVRNMFSEAEKQIKKEEITKKIENNKQGKRKLELCIHVASRGSRTTTALLGVQTLTNKNKS